MLHDWYEIFAVVAAGIEGSDVKVVAVADCW